MSDILFLTHYFPPEVNAPANRTYEHCKIWAKDASVRITVLTNFPNHPDGVLFKGYRNRLFSKENIDGINVIRLLTFVTKNEGFLLRTLNYIWYMIIALLYVIVSRIKFDVVIATSPQFFCGVAGMLVGKIKRKPFILELRDLWPESIEAVGVTKSKGILSFLSKIEMSMYRSAKRIVSVTRSFVDILENRGINRDKMVVYYNGVSPDLFLGGEGELSNTEISDFLSKGINIGYIGTVGLAHAVDVFVRAASLVKDTNFNFIIVGAGAARDQITKLISDANFKNIKLFSLQEKSEIPKIIARLDYFAVHLKRSELFKSVIPSKIFEGMIMKKPILIGVDGEARRIVEDAQCGLFFEPENENDLIEKLKLLELAKMRNQEFGANGYRYVLENFNRVQIADRYLQMLKKETIAS